MNARIPLPPSLQGVPFSVSHGIRSGLGLTRLRGADLARPYWGVRAPQGLDSTSAGRAAAYAKRMPPAAFYSHITAAQLWGIPLPFRLERRSALDVSVPIGLTVPSGKGVTSHRLQIDAADVVGLGDVRLTSLARTWCDLATLLFEEELVAAGDFLLSRRRKPHLRLVATELTDVLDRFYGRRGRPKLLTTIPFLCDRSDSPPESILRWRFAQAGLPHPVVNAKLYDSRGVFIAMPDLTFLEYRVTFDYEGGHHNTDPQQWEKDIARVPRLEDANWKHLRGSRADYRDSRELIGRLTRRLVAGGWQNPAV